MTRNRLSELLEGHSGGGQTGTNRSLKRVDAGRSTASETREGGSAIEQKRRGEPQTTGGDELTGCKRLREGGLKTGPRKGTDCTSTFALVSAGGSAPKEPSKSQMEKTANDFKKGCGSERNCKKKTTPGFLKKDGESKS